MNNKTRNLRYIRYKNKMRLKGYKLPKWQLLRRKAPYIWIATKAGLLEENWMIDMAFR